MVTLLDVSVLQTCVCVCVRATEKLAIIHNSPRRNCELSSFQCLSRVARIFGLIADYSRFKARLTPSVYCYKYLRIYISILAHLYPFFV